MEHSADATPLSTVQQSAINSLAAGSTLTDAAEAHGVHRTTIYRWIKNNPAFSATLHRARAEFVLSRRDDLFHLSNRALETLLAVLDNPRSSPAVLLRTAVFILQRPQMPKTGWSMPEPAPDPDGAKLLDSAIIEQDYDRLPGLSGIENDTPAEAPQSPSAGPSPPPAAPAPDSADATPCNGTQHDFENFDAPPAPPTVAPRPGLRSCPVPPAVLEARRQEQIYREILDELNASERVTFPKIPKPAEDDAGAIENEPETEETPV